MPLELEGVRAAIAHFNFGKDEKGVLVADAKLMLKVEPEVLIQFDPTLRLMLFTKDGAVRYPMMEAVGWGGEMKHHELTLGAVEFADTTLKNFEFEPRTNGAGVPEVALTMTATFKPSGRELAIVSEALKDPIELTVKPQPQLDLTVPDVVTRKPRRVSGKKAAEQKPLPLDLTLPPGVDPTKPPDPDTIPKPPKMTFAKPEKAVKPKARGRGGKPKRRKVKK